MSYSYPQCAVELRILPEDFTLNGKAYDSPYRLLVQARNVTINVNDYKTTDTFNLEIDYKNFPFDPRLIRACGVVIYMQDMERLYKDDGSLNKIVPGEATKLDPSISNAIMIGFVDEESIEFDDQRRTVKFEGRDTTALLIDQKYVENKPISLEKPIDKAIGELLATFKATSKIAVLNKSTAKELPTLAKFYSTFGQLSGYKNTGPKETYWEIIQDIANRAGLICYMSSTNLSDKTLVPALILRTPIDRRNASEDIKMIYGINIKNLKLKRKLGRFKGFNIQVRCFDPHKKVVLVAKIPEEANVEWGTAFGFDRVTGVVVNSDSGLAQNFNPVMIPVLKPDGSLDKGDGGRTLQPAPYITFPVPDGAVCDHAHLVKVAQTIYEQYSAQQLEGSFDTFEMQGRGSNKGSGIDTYNAGQNYDLLHIKKGQTICLEIDTGDLEAISRFSTPGLRSQYLQARGYDEATASMFAKIIGKYSPRFQIKSYSMSLDDNSGFKLSVNFQSVIDLQNVGL